ncbi:MAG: hypothetical protein GF383_15075 [Candidatus Lokiarchaeota archaeon]|nr:hypothetical protein [Candidatus Lokiarchaeota archaeon]MBD3342838.1 hypothetical protein [Candidatus Lokiarchaeota archaeon]
MKTEDFVEKLAEAQDLMKDEKYQDAIVLLEKLKEIEKKGEFDYSLTHTLYQLLSNSHSLYNQQTILKIIDDICKNQDYIEVSQLNDILKKNSILNLEDSILCREIELLILRGLLPYKFDGQKILF